MMLPESKRPKDVEPIIEPERPTKTTKVLNRVVAAFLILAAICLGVILKWSFQSTDVLVVKNSPFPARVVNDPSGETGGIVFLTADFCKNSDSEGTLRMSYVSKSTEILTPITKEKLPKGCDMREIPVVIPKSLPKDTYRIKFHDTFHLNPLKQDITVNFESREFEVGAQE